MSNKPSSSLQLYSEEVNKNLNDSSSSSREEIDITSSETDSTNPEKITKNPTRKRWTPSEAKKNRNK